MDAVVRLSRKLRKVSRTQCNLSRNVEWDPFELKSIQVNHLLCCVKCRGMRLTTSNKEQVGRLRQNHMSKFGGARCYRCVNDGLDALHTRAREKSGAKSLLALLCTCASQKEQLADTRIHAYMCIWLMQLIQSALLPCNIGNFIPKHTKINFISENHIHKSIVSRKIHAYKHCITAKTTCTVRNKYPDTSKNHIIRTHTLLWNLLPHHHIFVFF